MAPDCQIHFLDHMSQPLGRAERVRQLRSRIKRIVRRRASYLAKAFSEVAGGRPTAPPVQANAAQGKLHAGDRVHVKTHEEIQATLDRWNSLRGTAFMEEMWPYCGTTHAVLRRVDRFLDERDYRMKKCAGIVLLRDAICEGTVDYGRCDRSCYFFWREEWLEKLD